MGKIKFLSCHLATSSASTIQATMQLFSACLAIACKMPVPGLMKCTVYRNHCRVYNFPNDIGTGMCTRWALKAMHKIVHCFTDTKNSFTYVLSSDMSSGPTVLLADLKIRHLIMK
jgi:hypothetical protein